MITNTLLLLFPILDPLLWVIVPNTALSRALSLSEADATPVTMLRPGPPIMDIIPNTALFLPFSVCRFACTLPQQVPSTCDS